MATLHTHTCPSCGRVARSRVELLRHIRLLHFGTPGFTTFTCNKDGCRKPFKSFKVYCNHLYQYHSHKIEDESTSNEEEHMDNFDDSIVGHEDQIDFAVQDNSQSATISTATSVPDLQRAAAVWLLKTRELSRLPQSTVMRIMVDVDTLYEAILCNIKNEVSCSLRAAGIDASLLEVPSFTSPGSLFAGLDTFHKQLQYFKKNFRFVVIQCTCNPCSNH